MRQKVLSAFRINIEKANTKGENKMKKNKMMRAKLSSMIVLDSLMSCGM